MSENNVLNFEVNYKSDSEEDKSKGEKPGESMLDKLRKGLRESEDKAKGRGQNPDIKDKEKAA